MTDLGPLGGNDSTAYAINDSGQIVGDSETVSGDDHAFIYSNGAMLVSEHVGCPVVGRLDAGEGDRHQRQRLDRGHKLQRLDRPVRLVPVDAGNRRAGTIGARAPSHSGPWCPCLRMANAQAVAVATSPIYRRGREEKHVASRPPLQAKTGGISMPKRTRFIDRVLSSLGFAGRTGNPRARGRNAATGNRATGKSHASLRQRLYDQLRAGNGTGWHTRASKQRTAGGLPYAGADPHGIRNQFGGELL